MDKFRNTNGFVALVAVLLTAGLFLPLSGSTAYAQATTGSIKGVVTDSTGAVITNADVTAREDATGIETKVKTNGEGIYNFPKLKPGVYTLTLESTGYKKQEYQQVTVNIGQDLALDAVLQTGAVSETVTITAAGEELLQKTEVQISNTFEGRKVQDLPSNPAGAGIDTLALLTPGVVPGFGNVNGNGMTLSVNGNRARSNNFTVDGSSNNDLSIGGPSFFVDNQDMVAQFQVITNNFSAEYGRNQGAVVNIVTKSGTNSYHGTAAWYHRDNSFLNSLDNIEKASGQTGPTPGLSNLWNGTFGGPIKKDKLFFFGSFQYINRPASFVLRSNNPAITADQFPALESAFPNNPVVQAITTADAFALTGLGTVGARTDRPQNGTVNIGGQNFRVAYPQRTVSAPFIQKEFSVRGDYKINDKNTVWYRHLYQNNDFINNLATSGGFVGDQPAHSQLATGTLTTQLSTSMVNEFRFGWSRLSVIFGGGCSGLNCIPAPTNIQSAYTNIAFTGLHDTNGVSLQTIGPATNLPQGRIVTDYEFADNLSKVIGRHQLKMGADFHRLTNSVPFLPTVNGAYLFSSGTQVANNNPAQVTLAVGQVTIDYTETDQFYYFQDDWKIKDNLTLNLGLRYENTGQPVNILHDISTKRESNPATAIWLQSLPLSARTFPSLPTDKNNFAPRLGFAWTPRVGEGRIMKALFGSQDSTVISGGYAVAYDPAFYNIMLNVSTASPLVFNNTTVNPASGAIFPLIANPIGTNVQAFATSHNIIKTNTFNPAFFNQTTVGSDFRSPYSQQWSLRWQRQFSHNNVFEVRYVGTHGVGLFQSLNTNPFVANLVNGFSAGGYTFPSFKNFVPAGVSPQIAGQGACVDDPATTTLNEASKCAGRVSADALVRSRNNTAQSIYHSLQTRWQGRLFNQLNLGANYTFSKSLDNASEIFGGTGFTDNPIPQDPFSFGSQRGYSTFDRRSVFNANFIWDVPFYKEQRGLVGHALGGWQINGTYIVSSGQRYTPLSQFNFGFLGQGKSYDDTGFDSTFIGEDALVPFVSNLTAPATAVAISQIDAHLAFGAPVQNSSGFYSMNTFNQNHTWVAINPSQVRYIVNGPGAAMIEGTPFGNAQRNSLIGPMLNQLDLGLFKNIRVGERVTIQTRLEAFNALNHPNPGVGFVNNGLNVSSIPGQFVETAGGSGGFADNSAIEFARRVIQIGVKVIF